MTEQFIKMIGIILFIMFSLQEGYETSDQCYFSLAKRDASSFLSAGTRPSDKYCCAQGENKCREESNSCGKIFEVKCENGGTCHRNGCSCQPGYTGKYCTIDINECDSSPCKNNATCVDRVNGFHCICTPRIYGVLCDTNICHPTPADVVFVLNSSVSMTEEEFNKQLEFVANFSSKVPIGPRDFQISVVTFSSEAHVEFYLNQYNDNTSVHDAIMNITYKPGTTRTDEALKVVRTKVFTAGNGIERRINDTQAERFVYILTDGMSAYKADTKAQSQKLKYHVSTVAVVGIGKEVLHKELVNIASHPSFVYSVKNFNSLYTVLKQLVHYDCDECVTSAVSDVAIFLDSSYTVTDEQFSISIDAICHIIDTMKSFGVYDTQVSVSSFSDKIRPMIEMGETFDKNIIKRKLTMITKSASKDQIFIESIFAYARNQILNESDSRQNAKKYILLFTNGKAKSASKSALEKEKYVLENEGVNIFAVGSGKDINFDGLLQLVSNTFNVFITEKDSTMSNLDVLQSEFVYSKCNLKGE